MSVVKKTEMCICVCNGGVEALLSSQSSYREGPLPQTYTHFGLFSLKIWGKLH